MQNLGTDHQILLGTLSAQGIATSKELQAATGKSQATVSRLLADLSDRVMTLGHGRARRYGMPQAIRGLPAQQPIYWVDEAGQPSRLGTLTFLTNQRLHIETDALDLVTQGALPWFLTPLRAQGFLGRLLAQHLQGGGLEADPDRWALESILFGALNLHDAPGAIMIGEPPSPHPGGAQLPSRAADLARVLDDLSTDVARTLPAGSSAGGEQPKFLAVRTNGTHVLVKFTPPLGTPFGDRWHDLLHTEALALNVLARYGIGVARPTLASSARRTYLISERFDRIGAHGRRHVVSIGAAHAGFIATGYNNWSTSCEQLAQQKRLSKADANTATLLWHFGRLIGNTDMHSGNLGLLVERDGLAKGGPFQLAPVYDMLAMRWRPDPSYGGAADYSPFEPDMISAASAARPLAQVFWQELASLVSVSVPLRTVAEVMAQRLAEQR